MTNTQIHKYTNTQIHLCQFFGHCCQDFRWVFNHRKNGEYCPEWLSEWWKWWGIFPPTRQRDQLLYIYFTGRHVEKNSFSHSCKTSTACSSVLVGLTIMDITYMDHCHESSSRHHSIRWLKQNQHCHHILRGILLHTCSFQDEIYMTGKPSARGLGVYIIARLSRFWFEKIQFRSK